VGPRRLHLLVHLLEILLLEVFRFLLPETLQGRALVLAERHDNLSA